MSYNNYLLYPTKFHVQQFLFSQFHFLKIYLFDDKRIDMKSWFGSIEGAKWRGVGFHRCVIVQNSFQSEVILSEACVFIGYSVIISLI